MISPERLREHYQYFLSHDRVLLTGHSHQAWPDVARRAMVDAFDDAARHVDDKWSAAFEVAAGVRQAIGERIQAQPNDIALAQNTHDLVVRLLSALPLKTKRKLIVTTGEFHTIHRQLRRLSEEGIEVVWVDAHPTATLCERIASAVDDTTCAVFCSWVLFETSHIVPDLAKLDGVLHAKGITLLLDAYHAFNVVPIDCNEVAHAFVVAGGYKYAQWGEGVCFIRVPSQCELRPVITGWFADFAHLSDRRTDRRTSYGEHAYERFAGATYDPVSHYRAWAVAKFFDGMNLTVDRLRALSIKQTTDIVERLQRADCVVASPIESEARGGFVSVRCENAKSVADVLRQRNVWVDTRGDMLRLGPAPYTTDDEIEQGVTEVIQCIGHSSGI